MSATVSPADIADGIRDITDDEVDFYRENGWVKIDGLISRDLAEALLVQAKELMGVSGDDIPVEKNTGRMTDTKMAAFYTNPGRENPLFRDVSRSAGLAGSAQRLINQGPLRLFSDSIICKVAAGGEASGDTKWHQDGVMLPIDRAFGGGFWIPFVEVTPDMGCVQYLSGSHNERPLGRYQVVEDPTPEWLFEKYEASPAFHLQPGDALAHDALTFHGASPNVSNKNRWAWTTQRFPANALYTGAANSRTDGLGLKVNQPLDHEFFPLVAE
jgi:ectoine hydroxylase-related dioxygenase (phytanoyl-CoA dioxygenase family)